ncbi:MAG: molybdenum ABC transporter ATP-binding protein [bacterium]|nr:molybdenum ABC transporter ATP-binding protein [Candidatus Kapabacteria bacterium]
MSKTSSLHAPLAVSIRLSLDRFTLDVDVETTHRVTGVFGVSGSGKTSLLETIAGLRRDAVGRVAFGETIWLDTRARVRMPPEKRGIGYVPQDSLLFPHLDVRDNLRAGRARAIASGHDFDDIFETAVRVLDIGALLDQNAATLSGGERQRVALGRALCSGPRLMLLDEPLASLDVALRRKVLPFLYRVQSQFALPMLVVSHNPVEVMALCDDLIVLRDGKVIARGEPRQVLTRPEVFPLAEQEGYENVLPATVVEHRVETSIVRLGTNADGPTLTVPRASTAVGGSLLVSIAANEIMLALERPRLLSARNIIAARVESVQPIGGLRLITASITGDSPPIVAEVTADAVEELHSAPGTELFIIVKTPAVTLYEG